MALALGVRGLMNVQYVIAPEADADGPGVFVIEVNPRSSRTVPFISKVTGVPMVDLAVGAMLGRTLAEQGYPEGLWPEPPLVAVKAPVFSMSKLGGVDAFLGPEMKSTGEVMGVDVSFEAAVRKALIASDLDLHPQTPVLLSLADRTKAEAVPLIRALHEAGCPLYATPGTADLVAELGIPVSAVTKLTDDGSRPREPVAGQPTVADVIADGRVRAVVNTLEGKSTTHLRDGFYIRRQATEQRIPCFTSLDTAGAAIRALAPSRLLRDPAAPRVPRRRRRGGAGPGGVSSGPPDAGPRPPGAVLFDLDGTLLDSLPRTRRESRGERTSVLDRSSARTARQDRRRQGRKRVCRRGRVREHPAARIRRGEAFARVFRARARRWARAWIRPAKAAARGSEAKHWLQREYRRRNLQQCCESLHAAAPRVAGQMPVCAAFPGR